MTVYNYSRNTIPSRRLLLIIALLFAFCGGIASAQNNDDKNDGEGTPSLSTAVAKDLLSAYELLEKNNYKGGLAALNNLMSDHDDDMTPFDRASVLQIRGSAEYNLNRYKAALQDFQSALKTNALPEDQGLQLRFNVAQLYFQQENYPEAVKYLRQWLANTKKQSANAFYLLAAANYYQDKFDHAGRAIIYALRMSGQPKKSYYELANIIFSKTDDDYKRALLLRRMIHIWPENNSYWKQLAGLYGQQKSDVAERKAFATLNVAYRAGLLHDASDVITLAQYYSSFDDPYHGAKIVAINIKSGVLERNVSNLKLLAQLLEQAREHDKAIPVLREAARKSEDGKLYFRLGQAMLADVQYDAAGTALTKAIDKGGLSKRDQAEAWLLLGTARFNEAGPGDQKQRAIADDAFAQAQRYAQTSDRAGRWRKYIDAINETEIRQAALENQERARLAQNAEERLGKSCRTQRLSGQQLDDECVAYFKRHSENDKQPPGKKNENDSKKDGRSNQTLK